MRHLVNVKHFRASFFVLTVLPVFPVHIFLIYSVILFTVILSNTFECLIQACVRYLFGMDFSYFRYSHMFVT